MADEKVKLSIMSEDIDSENIQEVISNASKVTEDIAKEAAETIAKRRKEKLTNELIDTVQKCEYTKKSTVLQLRRSNRVNQRMKSYMKELDKLVEAVKSGEKPITAWNDEAPALKKQLDKDLNDIDKDIDKSQRELDDLFPNSWSYRWNSLIPNRRN